MGNFRIFNMASKMATKGQVITFYMIISSNERFKYRTKVEKLYLNCLTSIYKIMQTKNANKSVS